MLSALSMTKSCSNSFLPGLEDYASIRACLQGRCGSRTQEWAEAYCRKTWTRLRDEARDVRFRIGRQGWGNIGFEKDSLTRWSRSDQAFFGIFPELVADGHFLDEALDVIGMLDRRIADEALRLHDDAVRRKIELGTEMFAISYVFSAQPDRAPGISAICADLHSGVFMLRSGRFQTPNAVAVELVKQKLIGRDLSPGQLLPVPAAASRGGDSGIVLYARNRKRNGTVLRTTCGLSS